MPNLPLQNAPVNADHSELFETLVAQLTDFAVFLMDTDGSVASWNPGVERILGYSETEWLGQHVSVIFTREDRACDVPANEIETAERVGKAPDTRWLLRKDGRKIFVEGTLVALRGSGGELLGFSKVIRDITERKVHEEQLQDAVNYAEGIVNAVGEPLVLLSRDDRVRYVNAAFCDHFKISKHEAENLSLAELLDGCWDEPQVRALFEDLGDDPGAVATVDFERDVRGLGHRSMVLKARRLWRDGKHTELTLLAIDDVTERRAAERAVAESERQMRTLMNATPAIISYIDQNLRYRMANEAYRRWFGVDPQELAGRSLFELFDTPAFSAIQPYIERTLNGESVSFQETYSTPTGPPRVLEVTYTPEFDSSGKTRGFMVLGSDVTGREEAAQALRASEERWRRLFEDMSEAFFVGEMLYDGTGNAVDFRFLEVNPAFERITGVACPFGKTVREAIPGVQEELIATYADVVRTGKPAHFEITIPALKDRSYEARARAIDEHRFAVLFLDISGRKHFERQLQRTVALQSALVTLGDRLRDLKDVEVLKSTAMEVVASVLELDRAGYGEVDTSQAYVHVRNDWHSARVGSLVGSYRFSDFGRELGKRLGNGETVVVSDVSTDPLTSDESLRWIDLDIRALVNVPLIENGRLVAILFVQSSTPRSWSEGEVNFLRKVADRTWIAAERARAIQELQESEDFNRSVLASTPDCVKVLDLDGRLLTMNEGGCRQMEIDDLSLLANCSWSDFWSESKGVAEHAVAEARAGRTSRFEAFCPTMKNAPRWWEVVVTPILDSAGRPVRILSLSRDITDRKYAEKERERLTGELKRSNEELSQFAHIVAHDLQAPLRGVASFAQLLARKSQAKLSEHELLLLDQITGGTVRMQEFVQAVLRFAQVGQGEIVFQPVPMEQIADSAVQTLDSEIQALGATVRRGELPMVLGDAVQLTQLVQNLLSNALKYRRPGVAPEIAIEASRNGSGYVFAIADNGEGIAPEYLDKIFEPLQRLHGSDVPGTGLGLTICQRIALRHNGRIWAESERGRGSTFFFELPNA